MEGGTGAPGRGDLTTNGLGAASRTVGASKAKGGKRRKNPRGTLHVGRGLTCLWDALRAGRLEGGDCSDWSIIESRLHARLDSGLLTDWHSVAANPNVRRPTFRGKKERRACGNEFLQAINA